MRSSIFSSSQKSDLEALKTSASPFRLILHALHGLKPSFMVIVIIYDLKSQRLRIPGTFVLSDQIFIVWIYVRIAIIYDRGYAVLEHSLYYCAGAWRTACMEKNLGLPHRRLYLILFLSHKPSANIILIYVSLHILI